MCPGFVGAKKITSFHSIIKFELAQFILLILNPPFFIANFIHTIKLYQRCMYVNIIEGGFVG